MLDNLKESLRFYRWFLYTKFRQNQQEAVEILLTLVLGHVFGYYNPHQLSQRLGIPKTRLYEALKSWSLYQWRRQLMLIGCEYAVQRLRALQTKSAATQSRMRVTLAIDDTVVDRCGRLLSLTYSWWSGRAKKVIKGQNILGITLKIGDEVIPLAIRPIGKQGRTHTSKPEVFETLIVQLVEYFETQGIQIMDFPCSFDSWYGSYELVLLLTNIKERMKDAKTQKLERQEDQNQDSENQNREIQDGEIQEKAGFDQIIIHTKSRYVYTIDGVKQPLSEHKKRVELKSGQWGCGDIAVARCQAESPTFGALVLLFFRHGGKTEALMALGRKLRAAEILSIWHQHHGIEQFWKSLKSVLHLGSMSLRGRGGVYAELVIKVMAYVLMLQVGRKCHLTLHQLQMEIRKQLDIEAFFREHFHPADGLMPA